MLAVLVTSAVLASLMVEIGIAVARTYLETVPDDHEDERQMNSTFKRTSGAVR
jgi:hypothetical protein